MKERIRQILEWTKLSQQDFATRLGISPASLSSIFTGRTNPTNNHVQAIHRAFPEIDISWLLFGEGMMMVSDGVPENEHGGNEAMTKDNEGGASSEQYAMPSMFSDEDYGAPANGEGAAYGQGGYHRENYGGRPAGFQFVDNAKRIDNRKRRIKEIRVFFDDGTYEAFVPSNGK